MAALTAAASRASGKLHSSIKIYKSPVIRAFFIGAKSIKIDLNLLPIFTINYMKKILLAFAILISTGVCAQLDSLQAGVYKWNRLPVQKSGVRESRQILQGHTTDLNQLKIHTSTLGPGQTNHPLQAYDDREELVVVKEGHLKVTINDSSKTLGPGSVVLIQAGDRQSFQNASDQPATYCVLAFKGKSPVQIQRGKENGGSLVKDWNELTVKKTEKGESRPIFDRPTSMFSRFEIHATTLNAGFESHPPHTHREEEIIMPMQGNVTMNIAGKAHTAEQGDIILLTPNVPHNLKNNGGGQCWYLAMKWVD
jgi:(S)-ureidoglycine aminohydrolase